MDERQPNNPLHGLKLEEIVTRLVDHYGWQQLGELIPINCFRSDLSVASSLKFLRRMPWAAPRWRRSSWRRLPEVERSSVRDVVQRSTTIDASSGSYVWQPSSRQRN